MLLRAAESHTTPNEAGKARQAQNWGGAHLRLIKPPTSNMDEQLRAQQHQNELRAFLRYEARLSLAYRQTAYARARRPHHDHGRRATDPVQIDCE